MADDALMFWFVLNFVIMIFLSISAYFMGKIHGSIETHQLYEKKLLELKEDLDNWVADAERKQKEKVEELEAKKRRRKK